MESMGYDRGMIGSGFYSEFLRLARVKRLACLVVAAHYRTSTRLQPQ